MTRGLEALSMKRTQSDSPDENLSANLPATEPDSDDAGETLPVSDAGPSGETLDFASGAGTALPARTDPGSSPSQPVLAADDTERPGPVNATLDAPPSGGQRRHTFILSRPN